MERRQFGELTCVVEQEVESPRLAVVLCHGYGAPATDLVPIGAELRRTHPNIRDYVRFYFPAAPLDLSAQGMPGGRAWWPIRMEQLLMASQTGRWEEIRDAMPDGLTEASDALLGCLEAIREETGLGWSQLVVGGFSQGAMLSTDVVVRLPERVAGLLVASGTLLTETTWRERATAHQSMEILQGHGMADPVLPFSGAEALRDLFIGTGHSVTFLPFHGGHTIDVSLIREMSERLSKLSGAGDGGFS